MQFCYKYLCFQVKCISPFSTLFGYSLSSFSGGQIGTYQSLERLRDRLNDDTMECVLGTDPKNLTLTCNTLVDSSDVEFILSAAPCTGLTSLGLKLSINGTVQFDSIFQRSTSVVIDNGEVVFGVFPRIFVINIAVSLYFYCFHSFVCLIYTYIVVI